MKLLAIAIAQTTTYFLNYGCLLAYCACRPDVRKTLPSLNLDKRVLRNLHSFLSLTLPAALMLCVRWYAWYFIIFVAGWRNEAELNASVIMVTLYYLMNCPNAASSFSYQTFTSYFLGKQLVDEA